VPDHPLNVVDLDVVDAAEALDALGRFERVAGGDLVDEAERDRLRRWVASGQRPPAWHPLLARRRDGSVAGYGAVVVSGSRASGDAAPDPSRADRPAVLASLLERLGTRPGTALADGDLDEVQVWVRNVTGDLLRPALATGWTVARRLAVLGRALTDVTAASPAIAGVRLRAYRPDEDDAEVVRVLTAAYAGTDEAGWDLERFRTRRAYGWFRPEDLLVAELADGRLGGVHWTKRRTERQGEVYNLAVDPDARGRGLGPSLLAAGLAHLRDVGCDEVVLWVDRANERAVRLYERDGFVPRWEDVALRRSVR
jgi:mycothiol synthase